jgi:uncharacterized membrane protein YdcZ (DUF606 family)
MGTMAKLKFRKWLNQLVGGMIQGGATSASAVMSVAIASSLGANVQALNFEQLKWAFIGGSVGTMFLFLKKSPLPNFEGNTETITKTDTTK